jgi:hypothetical protein
MAAEQLQSVVVVQQDSTANSLLSWRHRIPTQLTGTARANTALTGTALTPTPGPSLCLAVLVPLPVPLQCRG